VQAFTGIALIALPFTCKTLRPKTVTFNF